MLNHEKVSNCNNININKVLNRLTRRDKLDITKISSFVR